MSYWEASSGLAAAVDPAAIWETAYADPAAWPEWNPELKRASLDRALGPGAEARVVFRTGLRLRFRVVEFEDGRLFTDEARLPGARMGHRHVVEPDADGGSRLTNTIYVDGPLAALWRRILGPAASRALPASQEAIVALARRQDEDLASPA
jgi:Polyketide cyclase / dehydrase and lipid transport